MRVPSVGVAVVAALALMGTACGTRLDHADVAAAARQPTRAERNAEATRSGEVEFAPAGRAAAGALASSGEHGPAPVGSVGGRRPDRASSLDRGGTTSAEAGPSRSPVKLASVGTISGPTASSTIGTIQGLQAWIKAINAKGGVNGHEVRVTFVDDGADPTRHRAQVQDQVENEKVIAFIQNNETLSGEGSVDYLTKRRVPVVGSETASSWFYRSPMYFPQASSGRNLLLIGTYAMAKHLLPKGIRRLGTLSCTEAAICTESDQVWNEEGRKLGFEPVYRGRVSVAQPDFTAECLAARNARAEVIEVAIDTNSLQRLGASCARQGYRPIYVTGASVIADRLKDDGNLDLLAVSNVFPWFQTDTPATAEFHAALARYNPSAALGIGAAQGWVSGKMFEKAAARLPEPPTSAALLEGLWSLKDDTLGGLTQPLTFNRDQPAPNVRCWFAMTTSNHRWVSLDNFTLQCR